MLANSNSAKAGLKLKKRAKSAKKRTKSVPKIKDVVKPKKKINRGLMEKNLRNYIIKKFGKENTPKTHEKEENDLDQFNNTSDFICLKRKSNTKRP